MVDVDWQTVPLEINSKAAVRVKEGLNAIVAEKRGPTRRGGRSANPDQPLEDTAHLARQMFGRGRDVDVRVIENAVKVDGLDLSEWREMAEETIRKPKSGIKIAPYGWKLALSPSDPQIDQMARGAFADHDLYLCRYAFAVNEAEGESVKRVQLVIGHPSTVVYTFWPGPTWKPAGNLKAEANLGVGLDTSLVLGPIPAKGGASAKLVWQRGWSWSTAVIKAWGAGDVRVTWEIRRDGTRPWAGDNECYVLTQVPKDHTLPNPEARFAAYLKTRFWKTERYLGPKIEIQYQLLPQPKNGG